MGGSDCESSAGWESATDWDGTRSWECDRGGWEEWVKSINSGKSSCVVNGVSIVSLLERIVDGEGRY